MTTVTNPSVRPFNVFLRAVFLQTKRIVQAYAGCSATYQVNTISAWTVWK